MGTVFRSLLPISASAAERAQEQATTETILQLDTNMVRKVKNPETCPAHLLPWLAWERAVDFWDEHWSEAQKRQVLREAPYVHRHRGTTGAVLRALQAIDIPATVVEWWQEQPCAAPYTFRVELQLQRGVDSGFYQRVTAIVMKAKNLRSHLRSIGVNADVGQSGQYFVGGAVTAYVDVVI
ncbi:phage tail protein I [Providencia alcalifaciens]|uniref:phage tail protein I n=1 Tax=Providencia alcalifaciens TaxID=126385 RepID=UPI0012B5AACA|nr:phage tail protein I [Providencia alcalifaciens]MTC39240.1 phage tail protein I [Providencia alcalifaciens]